MKKILSLSLLLGSALFFVPEAKAADVNSSNVSELSASAQTYRQRQRWNRRGVRVVNRTRIVRRGWATYREVWQYRYLPNGGVNQRLISRTRIR